ncbi:MAG: hypothetical protein ACM3X9_05345 [Bacillota bacterium]
MPNRIARESTSDFDPDSYWLRGSGSSPSNPTLTPTVYTAGYFCTTGSAPISYYWENQKSKALSTKIMRVAMTVQYLFQIKFYVSGSNIISGTGVPSDWVGSLKTLPSEWSGAYSVYASCSIKLVRFRIIMKFYNFSLKISVRKGIVCSSSIFQRHGA